MIKYFIQYLPWALVQQCLVLLPFWFLMPNDWHRIIYSILIFSFVGHLGNSKLTMLTLLLAVVTYPMFFMYSFHVIYIIVIIHAMAGAYLKSQNFEMRVWRFEK